MPVENGELQVGESVRIPLAEFNMQVSRSSGPGGQNVNKVNSRVQLWWDLTTTTALPPDVLARLKRKNRGRITREGVLQVASQEFRTQLANRHACVREVEQLVAAALIVPRIRKATKPSKGAVRRRLKDKKEQSQKKQRRTRPSQED
ncbi:MAG: alternative ribosome rescue aminoacyl-tRNA hydrolase ArfB [Planctomycetaceae bacterium]